MNPYQELFGLYFYERNEFFRLTVTTLFQHFILFYFLSVLIYQINPALIVLGAVYGELFLSLYLTQQLHFVWVRRNIQD